MALDEALMETVEATRTPILRLYAWEPACLSIGYAQPARQVDIDALARERWELVRRPTGGRAILHTDELTYAVIGPAEDDLFAGGILPSYRRISRGLLAALHSLGLDPEVHPAPPSHSENDQDPEWRVPQGGAELDPVCFRVPGAYEITVRGKKLVGSAQVRRRGAALQHGSLPLTGDIARVCEALRYPNGAQRIRAIKRLRASASTVEALRGSPVTWGEAADALQQGFESAIGVRFASVDPSPEELSRADDLARSRHRSTPWIERI